MSWNVRGSVALLGCVACHGSANTGTTTGSGGAALTTASAATASNAATATNASATTTTGAGGAGGSPPEVCAPPIKPVDTSAPKTVLTTCTEAALAAAVGAGGVITFSCGGPKVISLTTQIEVPIDKDTTIDGGGNVTLDGGGATRIFHFSSPNFRANTKVFTLQHLKIQNAKSTGTMLPQAPPPCSQGYGNDAGGAAVWMRDGVLHVIDVDFTGGAGASPGPDVAGGAIYTVGSLDVTIVSSRFDGNSASNGGAVGSLFSNLTLANDVFTNNHATGSGENYIDPSCTVNGGESGNGGNGGAVVVDGGETFSIDVCGVTFSKNNAGGLGGAMFRTPDAGVATTKIERSTADANQAHEGGGAFYFHHSNLDIEASTISNGTSDKGGGGLQADDTTLTVTNATFVGNAAKTGLGGAVLLFGNGGTVTSATFASNHADGGSGLFGAAIAGGTALTILDTLFQNNTSMDCGAPMQCQDGSSNGTNDLQWPQNHVVCMGADAKCASGVTFVDAKLGMLAQNGGPTETALPAADSPAKGAGSMCPPTDQRGNPRPATGCTIGAVEVP